MIVPSQIINHLKLYLPRFTDLFTEYMVVESAISSFQKEIFVTVTNHGLNTGDKVIITNGTVVNTLDLAVKNNGTVTFTCRDEHDFIKPKFINDDKYLTLAGFSGSDSVWNGQHEIIDIPNRTKFTINLPTGVTTAPSLTFDQYLIEDRVLGVKGLYEITKSNDNLFKYRLGDVPEIPLGVIQNMEIVKGFRITGASDFERAKESYTKYGNNKLWLFLIMDSVDPSKDRYTADDSLLDATNQDFNLLRLIQNFGTWVFFPTKNDRFGVNAQELAYGEVFNALVSTLYAFRLENENNVIPYKIVSAGHSPGVYNTAFYTHIFDWQQNDALTYENSGLQDLTSVAFRDIESTWNLKADDMAQLQLNINLDEEN